MDASSRYPVTIWAFDSASIAGRVADWGPAGAPVTTLMFLTQPDPASLDDYRVTFEVESDESGQVVIEGVVSTALPHPSSNNVFINALAIGQATVTSRLRITNFKFQPDGENSSVTWTSMPGKIYAIDLTSDLKSWPVDIEDGVEGASDAEETTHTFDVRSIGPRAYIRVREISGG